jgi:CBS domain-containing protein
MEAMREETQAEEPQIGQERAQSEARLGSLAVLQRRIRELLPTLPAAVALGHQAPVRDAIEVIRQKQLSCVLVVERGQLVGVFTERDVVTQVAATPLDVDHVPLRDVMQPDPECLQLDDELVYALHQMLRGAYRHVPVVDEQRRPTALVSLQAMIEELVAAFPHELLNLPRLQRTPSPPRPRVRKGWTRSPRRGGASRAGDAWSRKRWSRSRRRTKSCQSCVCYDARARKSGTMRPMRPFIPRIARYGLPGIKTVSRNFNPSIISTGNMSKTSARARARTPRPIHR